MPPASVHFNGGVNLPDVESVMREITSRVPTGVRRVPDGEPGDRQQWIFFQLGKFWETPGLEKAGTRDQPSEGYKEFPQVRLAEGTDPQKIAWPNLGYADAYSESFKTFERLKRDGTISQDVRFQVEYPTPLASVGAWFVLEDQDRVEDSYERALLADLDRLLGMVPHEELAVQWDVAVEIVLLEEAFVSTPTQTFEGIVNRLARYVDSVPEDVPVGLHLCYGDYQHRHAKEPETLDLQVQLTNQVCSVANRQVDWFAFTVPQYQRDARYFAPLRDLRVPADTELDFALVPYHPAEQEPGTTREQVRLVDEHLRDRTKGWGICTECGMARAEREEVPTLLDLHREILAEYA